MKFYESGDNRKPVIFYFPVPVACIIALIMYWMGYILILYGSSFL